MVRHRCRLLTGMAFWSPRTRSQVTAPGAIPRDVVFFARVRDPTLLALLEFYRADIDSLRKAGFSVHIETRVLRAMFARGDVLFAWWWHSSLPVVLAWRLRGRRAVVTGAFNAPYRSLRHLLRKFAIRCTTRIANANLAISSVELSQLRNLGSRNAELAYLGIDTTYFRPRRKAATPTAVTVGQLNPKSIRRKGIDTAIRAASLVRKVIPTFTLQVIGPISETGRVWLEEEHASNRMVGVEIFGLQDRENKRRLLGEAWAYVQPSEYEGFGVAVCEAMACGTVPIVSHAGSLPEVVGDAGIVLEDSSPQALAVALLQMFGDDAERQRRERLCPFQAGHFSMDVRLEALSQAVTASGLWQGT